MDGARRWFQPPKPTSQVATECGNSFISFPRLSAPMAMAADTTIGTDQTQNEKPSAVAKYSGISTAVFYFRCAIFQFLHGSPTSKYPVPFLPHIQSGGYIVDIQLNNSHFYLFP